MNQLPAPWNTLEIAKLIVSVLTPLLLLILGLWTNRILKRFEAAQWANQKVIEKRLSIFAKTAPLLNDLLCFHVHVGNWKELSPPRIIEIKRELDKEMHVNAALFSKEFLSLYFTFVEQCFQLNPSLGGDAQIRALSEPYRLYTADGWDQSWGAMFLEEDNNDQVGITYDSLLARFAVELGVGLSANRK